MGSTAAVLRQAVRSLRNQPGFTAVAVLTLGLGIGAVTALYTLLDGVALRPLPYPQAERLVWIQSVVPRSNPDDVWGLSEGGYFHLRERSRTLASLAAAGDAFGASFVTLSGDEPRRVPAAMVSADALRLLGARTAAGRLFDATEDVPDGPRVVVLGHDFWRAGFGGDPRIVGTHIALEGEPHEVIGVMAPGVQPPNTRASLWLPQRLDPARTPVNDHWVAALGLLAPGATLGDAQRELAELTAGFPETLPSAYEAEWIEQQGFQTRVVPLRDHVLGSSARLLWTLFGAVGIVLLIAFANVASLFLVRAEARRVEYAVRTALGAGFGRLLRQGIAEALIVCGAAAALGLALAAAGVRIFAALAPTAIPRLADVAAGGRSVAFAALFGVAAALALGVLPALRARGDLFLLRGGRDQGVSRERNYFRAAIVAGQIALTLVLLAGAALLLRSFQQLRAVENGFDARHVLVAQVVLPARAYAGPEASARFYHQLSERAAALPGVVAAGTTVHLPVRSQEGCYEISFAPEPSPGAPQPCVMLAVASAGFFEAIRAPVRGSTPVLADGLRGAEVLVTPALAERLWPGADPIGRELWGFWWDDAPRYRVVGLTTELRLEGPDRPATAAVFLPPVPFVGTEHWGPYWGVEREKYLTLRTAGTPPMAHAAAVRDLVRELEPAAAIPVMEPMERLLARSESVARASMLVGLLGLAAGVALLLSAVGLYGIVAYVVGRRTREIGLRIALGARTGEVAAIVLRRALGLALVGVAAGLLLAWSAGRLIETLLYDVRATDPLALGGAAMLLVAVVMLAALVPTRRAMKVEPMTILRE
jgi:putative ABC transport system permease protein